MVDFKEFDNKKKLKVELLFELRETILDFDFFNLGEVNPIVQVHVILKNGNQTILSWDRISKCFHHQCYCYWNEEENPVLMWCYKSNFKVELDKIEKND